MNGIFSKLYHNDSTFAKSNISGYISFAKSNYEYDEEYRTAISLLQKVIYSGISQQYYSDIPFFASRKKAIEQLYHFYISGYIKMAKSTISVLSLAEISHFFVLLGGYMGT